jgi:dolichol-phosphate mannosyltransferase
LIAVNDGSIDSTAQILDRLAADPERLLIVHHSANQGYGAALRTGVREATKQDFEYCLFMDSDLTNDPQDIPRFADAMAVRTDVIKASRFMQGGEMRGVPWKRTLISNAGNMVARALFGLEIRDCTNGFRAVKTSILSQMQLKERGFPVIVEELYHCKFLARSFAEVPVVLTNRKDDQRPTSFAYDFKTLRKYFSYAWKAFVGRPPQHYTPSRYGESQ